MSGEPTVACLSDEELLRRAVPKARCSFGGPGYAHPRWIGVRDTFALGSTFAAQLCIRFGLDPNEIVTK